uniref:Uncharacterized protein n=1 Tax=Arundo donax TaxID=35708 RepID=A0A0A8YR59_ARUDO
MWLADFICRKKLTTSESLLSSFYFQINKISRRKVIVQQFILSTKTILINKYQQVDNHKHYEHKHHLSSN